MGWSRWNLLNTLQSRAFSCKLTSCLIHAAKLVQTHAKPCKVPPGFLATSRGVPRKKCKATGQKRRFSIPKPRNVLFSLATRVVPNLHVFSPICTFRRGCSYLEGKVSFRTVLARKCTQMCRPGIRTILSLRNHYPKRKTPGLSSGGVVSCDAYAAGITRREAHPA